MGSAAKDAVAVDDIAMIATSYPEFFDHMATLGAEGGAGGPMIIAIDGTTSSGKGTLAKRLAKHYGLPHLDTGLLYRAVAKAALDAGIDFTDERECARLAARVEA